MERANDKSDKQPCQECRPDTFGTFPNVGGSYYLSATGKKEPCESAEGSWSGGGSVNGEISGGGKVEPWTDYLYDATDITGTIESGLSGTITVSGTTGTVSLSYDGMKAVVKLKFKGLYSTTKTYPLSEGADLGSFTFSMPGL